jgi:hypothetical protein
MATIAETNRAVLMDFDIRRADRFPCALCSQPVEEPLIAVEITPYTTGAYVTGPSARARRRCVVGSSSLLPLVLFSSRVSVCNGV